MKILYKVRIFLLVFGFVIIIIFIGILSICEELMNILLWFWVVCLLLYIKCIVLFFVVLYNLKLFMWFFIKYLDLND